MADSSTISTGKSSEGSGLFFKNISKDSTPVMPQSDFSGSLNQPLMQKMPKLLMSGFMKPNASTTKNLFQHQLDKAGASSPPGFHGLSSSMVIATPPNTPNMFSATAAATATSADLVQNQPRRDSFLVPDTPVQQNKFGAPNHSSKVMMSPPPSDDSPESTQQPKDAKSQINNMIRLFSAYQNEMDRKDSLLSSKESELRESKSSARLLQENLANYKDRVGELNFSIDDLRKQQEEAHVMFSKLDEQYQINKDRLAKAEAEICSKTENLDALRSAKHEIDCQLADIAAKNDVLQSERDKINQQFEMKTNEWQTEKQEILHRQQITEAALADLKIKIATTETHWSTLVEKERQLFEMEKEHLKDVVDGLKPENETLKEKLQSLELELIELRDKLYQSDTKCQEMRRDLDQNVEKVASVGELKSLLSSKDAEINQLSKSLDEALAHKQSIQLELVELKERATRSDQMDSIVSYFKELGDKLEFMDAVKIAIDTLQDKSNLLAIEAHETSLKQSLEAKEREIVLLREELDIVKQNVDQYRQAADQSKLFEDALIELRSRVDTLPSSDNQLDERFKQLQTELNALKSEKAAWLISEQNLHEELNKLKNGSIHDGQKWKEVILKYQADLRQSEVQISYLTKQRDDLLVEKQNSAKEQPTVSDKVVNDSSVEDAIMLEALNDLERDVELKAKGKQPLVEALMRRARTYSRQNSLTKRKTDIEDDYDVTVGESNTQNPAVFQTKISSLSTKKRRRARGTTKRVVSSANHGRGTTERRTQKFELVSEVLTTSAKPKYFCPTEFTSLPRLQHGLERVLFNPGVHFLRDPRTKVYNFDPYLRYITQPKDFNYDTVPSFISPSNDAKLANLAGTKGCKFIGSTSSTSSVLSQFYLLISNFKPVTLDTHLPGEFKEEHSTFTRMVKLPTAIQLLPSANGTVSMDYYSLEPPQMTGNSDRTILMQQGVILENFFTRPAVEYAKMLKLPSSSSPIEQQQSDGVIMPEDGYAYCQYQQLLLRSQLDCMNPHLPRQSFDIKTRATVAIRMNSSQYYEFLNYRLHRSFGKWNSFAREYYDMLRSAFLKYNFQVRIGNMDGLFVAYHNTSEIFGFQYICREEMDSVLFGGSALGDQVFEICLQLFNGVLERVGSTCPMDRPLTLLFSTTSNRLNVYAVDSLDPLITETAAPTDGVEEKTLPKVSVHRKWLMEVKRMVNGEEIEKGQSPAIGPSDRFDIRYQLFEFTPDTCDELEDEVRLLVRRVQRPRLSSSSSSSSYSPFSGAFFQRYFSPPDDDDSGKPIIVY